MREKAREKREAMREKEREAKREKEREERESQREKERTDEERKKRKGEEKRKNAGIKWPKPQPDPQCLRHGMRRWTAQLDHLLAGIDPIMMCNETVAFIHGRWVLPNVCEVREPLGRRTRCSFAISGFPQVLFKELGTSTLVRRHAIHSGHRFVTKYVPISQTCSKA